MESIDDAALGEIAADYMARDKMVTRLEEKVRGPRTEDQCSFLMNVVARR